MRSSDVEHPAPSFRLAHLIFLWVASRIAVAGIFALPQENYLSGDAFYYFRKLQELRSDGIAEVMLEYPVPAVWALQLPSVFAGQANVAYVVLFAAMMLVCDAVFTAMLWRSGGSQRRLAAATWTLFIFAVGPLAYFRFDLLPAVLVGGALLASVRYPLASGVLAALGTGVKLWPALIWPALAARPGKRRWLTTAGFAGTGVLLVVPSVVQGGWARLISPLTWQSDRGLQIESIAATPIMIARLLNPDEYLVRISQYNAYEILTGQGIAAMLTLSSVLTIVGLVVIIAMIAAAVVRRCDDPWQIGMIVLAIVLIMIATNKTFSPQYVVWLGGPLAFLVLHGGISGVRAALSQRLAIAMIVLAVLTHLIYPLSYGSLADGGPGMALSTLTLAVRNLMVVVLAVYTVIVAFRPPAIECEDS